MKKTVWLFIVMLLLLAFTTGCSSLTPNYSGSDATDEPAAADDDSDDVSDDSDAEQPTPSGTPASIKTTRRKHPANT